MSRQIKFRGKCLEDNELVYGYYGEKLNVNTGEYDSFIIEAIYNGTTNSCYFFDIPIDKNTVGQFTGFVDENKKNVYEGDILKKDNKIYEVIWGMNEPAFVAITKEKHCNVYSVSGLLNHGALVIGNIFENPELLED